ncbi:hypothetical protein [Paraclostridium sp. AKS73]|uniref:hypothetical protein n=1 Tax=Paraclostridium sp. AKS73 TaxID=2876116 RepID=UPI0021E07E81|nr:hypothetical protein [Paraclostridium sp. AKS73]MCU9816646.1 hypothetical protein [Paraclostridium sp. AKS73]
MKNNTYTPLPEATHSIRIGQLISTFGPGAIVDFTDQSLMTASTEFWKGKTLKIYMIEDYKTSSALIFLRCQLQMIIMEYHL